MSQMLHMSIVLALLPLAACGRSSPSSHVAHDLGRTANDESAPQWYDTSDEEYFAAVVNHKKGLDRAHMVPADDPATLRLQYWADAIDHMLRKRDVHKLGSVPRPKIKLIQSDEANAFVSGVRICLRLGISFSGPVDDQGIAEAITFDRSSRYFKKSSNGQSADCIQSSFSDDEEVSLATWQFSAYSNCAPEFQSRTVVLPASCLEAGRHGLGSIRKAKHLVVYSTSNQITVLSHVLVPLVEDEAVQVLAHELGHYYMSHQTTPSYQYGAFYRLGDTNPAQKPTSNPEAEALGKKLVDAFRGKIYFDDYASIEGQRFHSVLFSVLRNLAFELRAIECAGDSSCAKPCTLMAEFFADSAKLKPLEDFPWKKPGDDGINAYRAYEQLAQACVISIPLSNDPNVPGADQTPATSLKVSTVEQYLGYSSQELSNALKPLPLDENLGQLFDDVTSKIQDLQQAQASGMNQVLSEAMSFNLAVYTAEQEADELSAEWIDQLGINPAVGISSMIKLGREWAKREPPAFGEVPSDQCEALYQRGWRGEKGNSVMVPIAAWEGAHHSACYRAFNIDREIKVHNLTEYASTVRPEPGEPRWDEMVVSIVRRENL